MKTARSLLPAAALGLLGLLVLGIPISGLAQTPHACMADGVTHMGPSLGGVTTYIFYFDKDCPSNSNATAWRIQVWNYPLNTKIWENSTSMVAIPPNPIQKTLTVPRGSGYQVKVIIDFERSPGVPMNHTQFVYNP